MNDTAVVRPDGFHDHCRACGWTYFALTTPERGHWLWGPMREIHDRHEEEMGHE